MIVSSVTSMPTVRIPQGLTVAPANRDFMETVKLVHSTKVCIFVPMFSLKLLPNGLTSRRRKLKTWLYLRPRLVRPSGHLGLLWSRSNLHASLFLLVNFTADLSEVNTVRTAVFN